MKVIQDWKGKRIEVAESAGGVLACVDPLEGVVRGGVTPWPAPELAQKLSKSRQQSAFREDNLEGATRTLGFYSDLQSIHSEDAMTWSVFGPVAYAVAGDRARFVGTLLHAVSPDLPAPTEATISLWRRMPHPDTLVSGGPEIDVLIQTEDVVVLGEAKWRSKVGRKQGKAKDKDQIVLRRELFTKYGSRFFPGARHYMVLGIGVTPGMIAKSEEKVGDCSLLMDEVTWADVCSLVPHPAHGELAAYLSWKKEHSKGL